MDVSRYLLFVRAVETGNLSRAAAQLNYSQTAASHMLAAMEEELGIRLLYRGRNGVTLTEEGRAVYPLAKELAEREDAIRMLAGSENIHHGRIRVGVITSVAVLWMPHILRAFREKHPNVELQMNDAVNYETLFDWFSKDALDCAITAETGRSRLEGTPLAIDPYYLILPLDHPLAVHERITPAMLKGETFVIPSEGTSFEVGRILRQAKGRLVEHPGFLSDPAVIAMVSAGCGVSLLPRLVLDAHESNGILRRPLDPGVSRTIRLCLPTGRPLRPTTRAFAAFVREWVREHAEPAADNHAVDDHADK